MAHHSTEKYGEGVTAINQVHHAPIPGHPSTDKYRAGEKSTEAAASTQETQMAAAEVEQVPAGEAEQLQSADDPAFAEALQPGDIIQIDSVNSINPGPAKEETDAVTD